MTTTEYPTRDAWRAARRSILGGSEVAAVLGAPDAFERASDVWTRKCFPADATDDESERLEWGRRLEPVVLDALHEKAAARDEGPAWASWRATPLTIVRPDDGPPWMGASPDALVYGADGAPAAVMEAKTANRWAADDWTDDPPLRYAIQVQWTMACAGVREGYIGVLIGGQQFRWARVARNDAFVAAAIREAARFMRCVETRTLPEGIDPGTRDAVARLHPADDGSEVALPQEYDDLTRRWKAARDAKADAERQMDVIEGWICRALGGATTGTLTGGERWTWKTQKSKAYTVSFPERQSRVLRHHKAKGE